MDTPGKIGKRAPNFSTEEKNHLISIIASKYANVIEDKKTDRSSVEKKNRTWKYIEEEFNSSSPASIYRDDKCLKKFYDNRKKELRKTNALYKMEVIKTGGGKPPKDIIKDTGDSLLEGIVNQKTISGLPPRSDCDGPSPVIKESIKNYSNDGQFSNQIEFFLDLDEENPSLATDSGMQSSENPNNITYFNIDQRKPNTKNVWQKYNPEDLRRPMSSELNMVDKDIVESTPQDTPSFKQSANTNQESIQTEQPRPRLCAKRRRPVRNIQTLTSSLFAEKYNLLIDKRLALVEKQIEQVKNDIAFKNKKNSLEIELLKIELENKKIKN